MISSNVQLLSWIISILVGYIYFHVSFLYFSFVSRYHLYFRMIFHLIYIMLISLGISYLYYRVNYNVFHYSYVLFWFGGYYLYKKINIVKFICKVTRKPKKCK